MARFNIRDITQAISTANTNVNQYLVGDDGALFTKFLSNAIPPVLPTRTPVEDNSVGDGRAYPKQGQPYYFNPINLPYSKALNSTLGQRVLRMWLGDTIANTVNAVPGTTDQVIQMKNPGEAPMVCNMLRKLGGEYFIFGDCYVQTLEISQQGSGEPQVSAVFNNPGHYFKVVAPFDVADVLPLATPELKYHGAKTSLTFTDGVTSFDYATDGRLIDVSFSGNQNCVVDQLPGDTFADPANECYGAVAKNFFIDVQSAEIRGKVYMDANFAEFASWALNKKLTSVVLKFSSCEIIGLTTHHSEIEIRMPVGEFNLEGDQQGNFSAYSFTIKGIEGDPGTGSLIIGYVRRVTGAILT